MDLIVPAVLLSGSRDEAPGRASKLDERRMRAALRFNRQGRLRKTSFRPNWGLPLGYSLLPLAVRLELVIRPTEPVLCGIPR
jgi:hypothetical protein